MTTGDRNKSQNKVTGANHGQAATVSGEFMLCPRLPVVAQFRRWANAMKRGSALWLGVLLLASGCSRVSYMHPVVAEGNGLRVVERSTESTSSQGKPLSGAKIGLPTKSLIQRVEYAININTPLNAIPVMFLRAHDSAGSDLRLNGAHLHELDKRSAGSLDGDRYTFYLDAAKGSPLEFDVVTPAGTVLGHEKIEYKVVSRGHIWVAEGT